MSALKPSFILIETGCKCGDCGGLVVVSYVVKTRAETELNVEILRVVVARFDGSLQLGKAISPTREEKRFYLKQIGATEFGQAPGEAMSP